MSVHDDTGHSFQIIILFDSAITSDSPCHSLQTVGAGIINFDSIVAGYLATGQCSHLTLDALLSPHAWKHADTTHDKFSSVLTSHVIFINDLLSFKSDQVR